MGRDPRLGLGGGPIATEVDPPTEKDRPQGRSPVAGTGDPSPVGIYPGDCVVPSAATYARWCPIFYKNFWFEE